MTNQQRDALWTRALNDLKLQMTRATFDQWLKETELLSTTNQVWTIAVRNEFAQAWLENRLADAIRRTASQLAGHPVELEFIPRPSEPATAPSPLSLEADDVLTPGRLYARQANFIEILKKPFTQIPKYYQDFWLPYLGPTAYVVHDKLATRPRNNVQQIDTYWTEVEQVSYRQLADLIGIKGRGALTGCWQECGHSQKSRLLEQPLVCCHKRDEREVKISRTGQERCCYWYTGALEILYETGLIAVEQVEGAAARTLGQLRLQVWRVLPILTPYQVGQLSKVQQADHKQWLQNHYATLKLSFESWSNFPERSLVPFMQHYADGRKLHGTYCPNPFRTSNEDEEHTISSG